MKGKRINQKSNNKSVIVNLRLSHELHKSLTSWISYKSVLQSDYIRLAIREKLAKDMGEKPVIHQEKPPLEVARSIIGSTAVTPTQSRCKFFGICKSMGDKYYVKFTDSDYNKKEEATYLCEKHYNQTKESAESMERI